MYNVKEVTHGDKPTEFILNSAVPLTFTLFWFYNPQLYCLGSYSLLSPTSSLSRQLLAVS